MKRGNLIQIAAYLTPQQKTRLDRLSKITRVPMQVYLREGIDDLLVKYKRHLRGTKR